MITKKYWHGNELDNLNMDLDVKPGVCGMKG
jgi:hypothetical protein